MARAGAGHPVLGLAQVRGCACERFEQRLQFGQATPLGVGDCRAEPGGDAIYMVSVVHVAFLARVLRRITQNHEENKRHEEHEEEHEYAKE
jgi:hypothetical protein